MRYANVDTTLNVYTQVLDGAMRDAAETVESQLFRIVQKSGEAPHATRWSGGPSRTRTCDLLVRSPTVLRPDRPAAVNFPLIRRNLRVVL